MEQRPSQVSFYLAIGCLTLSICLFLVVVGILYQKWQSPSTVDPPPMPDMSAQGDDRGEIPRNYAWEDLEAELDDYLPPVLDEGRVRIAPPKRWLKAPRSKEYLARFWINRVTLPRITVTAAEAEFDEPATVEPDNVAEFVELVSDSIPEDERSRILKPAATIILGDRPCVHYVIQSKPTRFQRSGPATKYEQHVLKTLHAGRLYTVTLDAFGSTVSQYRDKACAVMAGLQFVDADQDDSKSDAPDSTPSEDSESADS